MPAFTQHISWSGATLSAQAKHAEHFGLLGGMNTGDPPVADSEQTFQGHPTVPRFKFRFHAKVKTF